MLQNAYFLAKIGADTAENEQHFAEILPIGRCVADRRTEALSPTHARAQHASGRPLSISHGEDEADGRARSRSGYGGGFDSKG